MTSISRVLAIALVSVLSVSAAPGQTLPEDIEAVRNWTAPPYWKAEGVSKDALEVLPQEEDPAVAPMGALPSPPLPLTALTPCRIVDTRGSVGPFGGPALVANMARTFNLPSGPCPGIPADADAYSLNLTIIGTSGLQGGFLTAWPTGSSQPTVSTMNFNATEVVANAAVVPAGTSGSINVFVNIPGHLLVDINGYYNAIPFVNTVNGLSGAVTLAAGANVSITPSGNTLTFANTAPAAWRLTGNSGTTPGTNFLGTTDNQPLEIKVNNARVMRYEPNATSPNVIGGNSANTVLAGVAGATIGGGSDGSNGHFVTDDFGTVGGGFANQAGDGSGTTSDHDSATVCGGASNHALGLGSTIAGGSSNVAPGGSSTIAGGVGNYASGFESTITGGEGNVASGPQSTVGGGLGNTASGQYSTVPGGNLNTAAYAYTLAAGRRAKANHEGSFVWGDQTDANVSTTAVNQFIVRASGGIWLGTTSSPSLNIITDFINTSTGAHLTIGGVWTDNSDVSSKENFQEVDKRELLSRVATLPITRWSYKAEGCGVEHLGPMAQDFSAAFGLGSDDRSISTLDSSGVALAAIQALYEEVQELRKRVAELEQARN